MESKVCNRALTYDCIRFRSFLTSSHRYGISLGLAFLGLSLSRHNDGQFSSKVSVSRQTAFDFDLLQDRDYKYFCSTNDDGWLVGKKIYELSLEKFKNILSLLWLIFLQLFTILSTFPDFLNMSVIL